MTRTRRLNQERHRLRRQAKRRALKLQERVRRKGPRSRGNARGTARRARLKLMRFQVVSPRGRKLAIGASMHHAMRAIGASMIGRAMERFGGWWSRIRSGDR